MFVQLATTSDTAAAAADSDSGHQVMTISLFLTFVAVTLESPYSGTYVDPWAAVTAE